MAQKKQVTKAVIAAAGFGTRFLPQTKAMPKEMIPLIDKPIIQYVVEELVAAGIKDIIIVGSGTKRAIEDHFDTPSEELLVNLRAGGEKKKHLLEEVSAIADLANFVYVRQKGPYGNATPVLCAAHLIGDEPFIYSFADDFFVAKPGRTAQMIETHNQYGGSVLACKTIKEDKEYDKFGVVGGKRLDDHTFEVEKVVEKPGKANAPSDLATVSGYLFEPEIVGYIEKAAQDHAEDNGELMVQPVMQQMIHDGFTFNARAIQNGTFYDTGDKLEYLKTAIDFGLAHQDLGESLRAHLQKRLSE
ncbi:UTP--glucose-1-phosphate uridylyltransferase [Candidatus Saccharibacteria bacterium]|nr:MAG: UTP--glucose-1-phosphate uridylyltransferase [Candidatus Saccharibacteria bacterium]